MNFKECVGLRADLSGLRRDPMPSSYELGNEASGSIKGAEIVEELDYYVAR
jgi:hypothetical protein